MQVLFEMRYTLLKSMRSAGVSVSLTSAIVNSLLSLRTLHLTSRISYGISSHRSQRSMEPLIPSVYRFVSTIAPSADRLRSIREKNIFNGGPMLIDILGGLLIVTTVQRTTYLSRCRATVGSHNRSILNC